MRLMLLRDRCASSKSDKTCPRVMEIGHLPGRFVLLFLKPNNTQPKHCTPGQPRPETASHQSLTLGIAVHVLYWLLRPRSSPQNYSGAPWFDAAISIINKIKARQVKKTRKDFELHEVSQGFQLSPRQNHCTLLRKGFKEPLISSQRICILKEEYLCPRESDAVASSFWCSVVFGELRQYLSYRAV